MPERASPRIVIDASAQPTEGDQPDLRTTESAESTEPIKAPAIDNTPAAPAEHAPHDKKDARHSHRRSSGASLSPPGASWRPASKSSATPPSPATTNRSVFLNKMRKLQKQATVRARESHQLPEVANVKTEEVFDSIFAPSGTSELDEVAGKAEVITCLPLHLRSFIVISHSPLS